MAVKWFLRSRRIVGSEIPVRACSYGLVMPRTAISASSVHLIACSSAIAACGCFDGAARRPFRQVNERLVSGFHMCHDVTSRRQPVLAVQSQGQLRQVPAVFAGMDLAEALAFVSRMFDAAAAGAAVWCDAELVRRFLAACSRTGSIET